MRVAIIDDEAPVREQVKKYVEDYSAEKNLPMECECFEEAVTFLNNYKSYYDVIFLDIKMPGYNGMEAAEILRKTDTNVVLVFITNLKEYAIQGYKVDAIGFVVKPLNRYDFFVIMDKVVQKVTARMSDDVTIRTANGIRRLGVRDIFYIEVIKHKLIFHTVFGDIVAWGTLVTVEETLPANCFSRCNVCYLVNLYHVKSVDKDTVMVGTTPLKIARSRKKEFLMDLGRFVGMGGM